jgi:surfactin synthase thioesterase subunit
MYAAWGRDLRPQIEVVPVQLPGREGRKQAPLASRFELLVGEIADAMVGRLERPYALFGHSMGSLLAFELCRGIRARGGPAPVHLFVSGRRAPHHPTDPIPLDGDDTEFVRLVQSRFGGIPDRIVHDDDLLRFFLPTLRADLRLLETYRFVHERALACPITAFGGRADPCVSPDELLSWGEHTTASFDSQTFDGGHFYLHDAAVRLQRAIMGRLVGWSARREPQPGLPTS